MILRNKNIDWLQTQAKNFPGNYAIELHDRKITYSELNKMVNAVSVKLSRLKVGHGDHVPFISFNDWREIVLILTLWRVGAVPVPLNSKLKNHELKKQIEFLDADIVVGQAEDRLELSNYQIACIDEIISVSNAEEKIDSKFNISDTAVAIFTSGSTGSPKAVELTFEALYESALATDTIADFNNTGKFFASLPFYHIGGFMIFIRSLLAGSVLQVTNDSDLFDSINKFEPTIISLVPTQLLKLIESDFYPYKSLETIFVGGGSAEADLLIEAVNRKYLINIVYGSSETCSMVTYNPSSAIKTKPKSVGKPLTHSEIKIVNSNNIALSTNEIGEIAVKTKSLFKSYLKNDSLKQEKMHGDYFKTGDVGYIDDDGYLFVINRREDIIVSGGENIDRHEVESAIHNLDLVEDVYVFGIKDKKWGQKLCAVIIPAKTKELMEETIKSKLESTLPSFKIPKEIFFVDALPKTELGKIDRNVLMKLIGLSDD